MSKKIRFNQIRTEVPEKAGVYEIHTDSGIPLKVGIGENIRKRLLQHRASRQSCLKLKPGGQRDNPQDVLSKGSILAKHLYYDKSLTSEFDLTTEQGRRDFLDHYCYILFESTDTKEIAREKERTIESSACFRYLHKVVQR